VKICNLHPHTHTAYEYCNPKHCECDLTALWFPFCVTNLWSEVAMCEEHNDKLPCLFQDSLPVFPQQGRLQFKVAIRSWDKVWVSTGRDCSKQHTLSLSDKTSRASISNFKQSI